MEIRSHLFSFSCSPVAILASFFKHRDLLLRLGKRDIAARYRGSILGVFWSFVSPVLMLSIYTFAYNVILKVKWGRGEETSTEFALIVFTGLMIFNFFSECIVRSTTLIYSQPSFVKKIVFPLEILPVVSLSTALFHMVIHFSIWLIFFFFLHDIPAYTVFYFPLILIPLILLILGLSWFLASVGVYVRDAVQVITLLLSTLVFVTPVFFPLSAVPEQYRSLFYLNPLTCILEQTRNVLIWGKPFDWSVFFLMTAIYAWLAWLGFVWFQKSRKGFADVL